MLKDVFRNLSHLEVIKQQTEVHQEIRIALLLLELFDHVSLVLSERLSQLFVSVLSTSVQKKDVILEAQLIELISRQKIGLLINYLKGI